jgi:hypothetical protein
MTVSMSVLAARVFRLKSGTCGTAGRSRGVFDPRTPVRGAQYARERVHFLGFVNELAFGPGTFGAATQFIANPVLFADAREARDAIATWPLQPARLLNGAD